MKFGFLVLLLLTVFGSTLIFARQSDLFEYDKAKPFGYEEKSVIRNGQAIVRDILFDSPKGGKVSAYLVEPSGQAKNLNAVIYFHSAGADRIQFLNEALALVKSGKFIALLPDSPAARPAPWKKSEYASLEADRDMRIQSVVDTRRALDILENLPNVSKTGFAFVGYSYGASIGGVLAGIEKRFKTFILAASGGSQVDFWRDEKNIEAINIKKMLTPRQFEIFVENLKPVEQINYVKNSAPAYMFFQFGKNDELLSKKNALKFYKAASAPKTVKWYEGGHRLNLQAPEDRLKFLQKHFSAKNN